MSATNAHRLGANEAPPAIISVFLGRQLSDILDKMVSSDGASDIVFSGKSGFKMEGIPHIPELLLDNTDRNRTSPFAFTGNRFEFRAVGSSANCAGAMTVLNTAVADQLNAFKAAVDARVSNGEGVMQAIYDELRKYVEECKAIHFDGNGYTDEWKAEAARRGLDCEVSAPLMFDQYMSTDSVAMFERTHVLNKKELEARTEVMWETYTKKIQIEARVLGDMAMNHILPVASSYESTLLDKIFKLKALFSDEQWKKVSARDIALVEQISA